MIHWTPEQRANAIGLALAVGADKAHEQTGIPRRTISAWLARERPAPELDALVATSREATLETLKAAAAEGAASLLSILRDPKAAHRDKVRAAEVALDRYQLMAGGVTSRSESVNVNVAADLLAGYSEDDRRRLADAIDAFQEAEAASDALDALPDPTAGLDKASVLALVNAIERRLGNG